MSLKNNPNDKKNIADMTAKQSMADKSPISRRSGNEPRDPGAEANMRYAIEGMQSDIKRLLAHHPDIRQHINTSVLANPSKMNMAELTAFKIQVKAAAQMANVEHDIEDGGESIVKKIAGFFEGKSKAAKSPLLPLNPQSRNMLLTELGGLQPVNLKNAVKIVGESIQHNTLA
jgi:hypothetical protein